MKAPDSVSWSVRATYRLEMFTFFRFGFQVFYCLDPGAVRGPIAHIAHVVPDPRYSLSLSLICFSLSLSHSVSPSLALTSPYQRAPDHTCHRAPATPRPRDPATQRPRNPATHPRCTLNPKP